MARESSYGERNEGKHGERGATRSCRKVLKGQSAVIRRPNRIFDKSDNLPAEESGIKAVEGIGNETHEGSDEAFTADVKTEAREGRGNSPDPSNSGMTML